MVKADVFVSVVAVLRSYARFLPAFVDEVYRTLDEHYTNFELVLIDNGSRDETPQVVRELLKVHKCIRYVRLSRRMKPETAVMAGLDAAIGDFVVSIHPELFVLCNRGARGPWLRPRTVAHRAPPAALSSVRPQRFRSRSRQAPRHRHL